MLFVIELQQYSTGVLKIENRRRLTRIASPAAPAPAPAVAAANEKYVVRSVESYYGAGYKEMPLVQGA